MCSVIEWIGLFSGLNALDPGLLVLAAATHTAGALYLFWFFVEGVASSSFFGAFVVFHFLPAAVDLTALLRHLPSFHLRTKR